MTENNIYCIEFRIKQWQQQQQQQQQQRHQHHYQPVIIVIIIIDITSTSAATSPDPYVHCLEHIELASFGKHRVCSHQRRSQASSATM